MAPENVAVGIVYHRRRSPAPPADGARLVVRVNADLGQKTPWLGFGANHNVLMDESLDCDWYIALNPDVEVHLSDLLRMVICAEQRGFAIVAPLLSTPWGAAGGPRRTNPTPKAWLVETLRGAGASMRDLPDGDEILPSAWVSGACMAIKISTGLRFDERYFMYFEDADLCARAKQQGYAVGVCTRTLVKHRSGWTTADPLVRRRGVEFARSAVTFAHVHGESPLLMRWSGALRYGSRLMIPRRTGAETAAASAIARGFATLGNAEGLVEIADRYNESLRL